MLWRDCAVAHCLILAVRRCNLSAKIPRDIVFIVRMSLKCLNRNKIPVLFCSEPPSIVSDFSLRALARQYGCAGSSEASLFASAIGVIFIKEFS